MGFIPQINTKTLYAYLTPKGREYILDGNKEDFQIAYFTLHDDDVNYFVSANISAGTTSKYLTLPSGFVPDITGDADTCIKSIAQGTNIDTMSSLSGSSITDPISNRLTVGRIGTDGNINTRVLDMGFVGSTNTIQGGSLNASLTTFTVPPPQVSLFPPSGGDNIAVGPNEWLNTQFNVEIVESNGGATDFTINGTVSNKVLIKPTAVTTFINITFKKGSTSSLSGSISISFKIKITPIRSFVNLTNSLITYNASIPIGGGGGGNQSSQ
jgi:hypothetical protein